MKTLLTFPGKIGDFFHQFRAARQFIRSHDGPVHLWLDQGTLSGMDDLLATANHGPTPFTWETRVGIKNYLLGGQPYDFGLNGDPPEGFDQVIHLGFRDHPDGPITLDAADLLKLAPKDLTEMVHQQTFWPPWPPVTRQVGRLVFHSPLLCHTGPVQSAWEVLVKLRDDFALEIHFPDILVVGTAEEVAYARELGFNGEVADWFRTASLLVGCDALLAGGSSVASLAGLVACPCCRIGQAFEVAGFPYPRAFNNLAPRQVSLPPDRRDLAGQAFDFLIANRR